MTPGELLLEGVEIMLFGIGFVFLFLVLLVVAIRVMSRLIEFFAPPAPHVATPSSVVSAKPVSQEPDASTLAAIQLAIHQHRARRG